MAASLLIALHSVAIASESDLATFFLFQSVSLPVITIVSQTLTLWLYRDFNPARYIEFLLIFIVPFIASAIMISVLSNETAWVVVISYSAASSIMLFIAMHIVRLQLIPFAWVISIPVLTSVLRFGVFYGLTSVYSIATSFLVAAGATALSIPIATWVISRSGQNFDGLSLPYEQQYVKNCCESTAVPRAATILFFAVTAFFFQVDKYLFSLFGRDDLVIISGVCTILVLSPISAINQVLYRANGRKLLYGITKRWRLLYEQLILFLIGSVVFGLCLWVLWDQLLSHGIIEFEVGFWVLFLLGILVFLDRCVNLICHVMRSERTYYSVLSIKLLTVGICFIAFLPLTGLAEMDNASFYAIQLTFYLSLTVLFFWSTYQLGRHQRDSS